MHLSTKTNHTPVLLEPTLEYLAPKPGETYLDLTAGYGGHAKAVLAKTKASATLVDRDQNAVAYLGQIFKTKDVEIVNSDFLSASVELTDHNKHFDLVLADLGVSSPQIDSANRGFSFQTDGPLDMRMDQTQELTAQQIVNTYDEADLAQLLKEGQEPKARQLAKAIVTNRPIRTTKQLVTVINKVVKRGKSKINPATKTFQTLRIAVNDELGQLNQALPIWLNLLKPGGRIAVISFHSLEDRLVKQTFLDNSGQDYEATIKILTKKPVAPTKEEIAFNPRARSAKLRAAVKIKI